MAKLIVRLRKVVDRYSSPRLRSQFAFLSIKKASANGKGVIEM